MPSVRELLTEAGGALSGAGIADAEREAGWLLAHVLGTSAGSLRAQAGALVPDGCAAEFRQLIGRRAGREPIQYILGTEEFMGMTFRVSPAVLIPRLDTETLVLEAAARLQDGARIADVGTGSGAVALGIASVLQGATVIATDSSPEALAVAQGNASANGFSGRIAFRQGDLLEPLRGECLDAILSNPPYIGEEELAALMPEVREWEPRLALTPGGDALVFYRRLAEGAPALLRKGGLLGVEVGAGQASDVSRIFRRAGYIEIDVRCDTAGVERVVFGRLP